ncbi:carboxypeptidase-like regulatory domain-containing protein [Hymenobacter sp. NST-14]|uniref:carboxypeptidase-like regulatory domain-containing protein n=1 Tax=Hymenobacter piscis TaxID=2839984 RepID=UPI001C02BC80|nr:carboxypeptidase-like regulatory domain-containing protein [Hymenobacter piscis]MBT9393053.1 carboxypeptidase-like regulatory domain-containing protein [Hymenobacter piscis]
MAQMKRIRSAGCLPASPNESISSAPALIETKSLHLYQLYCMKSRHFLLLSLGFAVSVSAHAQKLSGKVLDAGTGQPIPYASVGVPGTSQGTTSNAEGEFELAGKLPARLIVSELSHRADTVALTAGQTTVVVRLQPAAVALPDVVPGAYTTELIRKAYRHLQRTNRPTYGQAFYRQITRLDNDPVEVQEMVWHTEASGIGIEKTAPYQGRYAEKKALLKFKDFSLYTRGVTVTSLSGDSTKSKQTLSLDPTASCTFQLLGISSDGNRELVEIGFKDKTNPEREYGSLLIDANSYQLLRYRLVTCIFSTKINNPLFKLQNNSTAFEWVFRPTADGATVLDYLKVDHQETLKRHLKPDMSVRASAFTVLYGGRATAPANVTYHSAKKGDGADLQAIKNLPYDPAFWQNNSVVKRTPLEEATIKAFEQKGAFGTLLTP